MRNQQWDAALDSLTQLAAIYGNECRTDLLREKIEQLKANPPGADWDGVTNFQTK